ncbi:MAG: hypothetical protein JWO88_3249 [Frankiales bacterium]|nr:hypothetical protein [Frankiales bacterium]
MFWLIGALVVYLAVGVWRTRTFERSVKSLMVPAFGTPALLARGAGDGTSVEGSLRGAALLLMAVLVLTAGEPDLIMDVRQMKGRDFRRLPKAERRAIARRQARGGRAQLGFIAFVIVFVGLAAAWDDLGNLFA